MVRFNQIKGGKKNKSVRSNKRLYETVNYEGHKAYKFDVYAELFTAVASNFVEDKYYESMNDNIKRILYLCENVDYEFLLNLAVYTRKEMNMRTISLLLISKAITIYRNENKQFKLKYHDKLKNAIFNVINRADELSELIVIYAYINNIPTEKIRPIPKIIKESVGLAFNKFDEYQLSKYKGNNSILSLKDTIRIVHAKPINNEKNILFNKLVNDKLEKPYTWEVEFSELGKKLKEMNASEEEIIIAKRKKWEELIFSGRLPYMATLRNLRNMLQYDVSIEAINKVADYIVSNVENGKQLPFRYLSAYISLHYTNQYEHRKIVYNDFNKEKLSIIDNALNEAIIKSVKNISLFNDDDVILIASDVSRSMQKSISKNSMITMYDIGVTFGILLKRYYNKNSDYGIFGADFRLIDELIENENRRYFKIKDNNINLNKPLETIMYIYENYEGEVGYATYGYKVLEYALNSDKNYNKIVFFTDCQMYTKNNRKEYNMYESLFHKLKQKNKNIEIYFFDLAGYGNTVIYYKDKGIFLGSGWSDKIFDTIYYLKNTDKLIKEIINYKYEIKF